ncbi:transcriptional repressor [Methanonatronarchaeum sp. AMET-Sl]|uniref:transcriptional repressor n=1 Tax=Methanonatronarchaeum sp. AMET-Sl TaxID=3037654 RepID=UPI00244E50BF|nr:transcriptional repressor [Methanonatronarchaeum sp. AMET-Sl]WGI17364.1 transcriptional repressor [Methanonatronarchaeum sp. AMET-Sl]
MKMKLEAVDEDGVKTSMEFEGDLEKEVILERISKFIEALNLSSNPSTKSSSSALNSSPNKPREIDTSNFDELTIKKRLKLFLLVRFQERWFTSREVKRQYDQEYQEIGLSTVSTYLSRMAKEGYLKRRGNRVEREYRLSKENKKEIQRIREMKEAMGL